MSPIQVDEICELLTLFNVSHDQAGCPRSLPECTTAENGSDMSDPTKNTSYNTDVIVIGAGPIGLTTACALGHHGVRTRVFEERSKPKPNSRANNIWARVQELLYGIGVRDALAEQAYDVIKQTAFLNGAPLDQVPLDEVKSPFPRVLYSGQDVIEKTLEEQAGSRGAPVERRRKVTALSQDEDGVTVVVETVDEEGQPTGRNETLRCRYLIGADGDKGFVRKALGLELEPTKLPGRANRQVDAKLKWQRSTDANQLWFFVYHNGFAGVLPVWGGYHRMFFLEDEEGMPDRDPTLEELQVRAREVTGDPTLTFSDPVWLSHSRFQHGVTSSYAKGRVFLAGDAGHYTLPIGGQGMNAGMHDAVCIAWRLAMELAGVAGPAVLDSYNQERQKQHADLDERQLSGFKRLVYRNKAEDMVLDVAGELVPNLGSKMFGSDDLQQLSVAYPDSLLSEDHLKLKQLLKRGVPKAGDRAPDAELIAANGHTTTLFPVIYNLNSKSWNWNLFAFDGRDPEALTQLHEAAAAIARWSFVLPTLIIAAPSSMSSEAAARNSLSDLDGVAHGAYGLEGAPALILVRPDGHIAFRGPATKPELLMQYCERVFLA